MPDELPFIDEFDAVADASASDVFRAVTRRIGRSFEGRAARLFTSFLGCAHRGASYTVPPVAGQETNGFQVAEVTEPGRLVLEGRHRFASYRLSFLVEPFGERRAMLRARTDALFPGWRGRIYRGLVIGTGAHEVLVKRMLASMVRAADPLQPNP